MWRKLTLPFHSALFKQYGDAVTKNIYHTGKEGARGFISSVDYVNPLYKVRLLPFVAEEALKQNAKLIKSAAGNTMQEASGLTARYAGQFMAYTKEVYSKHVPKAFAKEQFLFDYHDLSSFVKASFRRFRDQIHFYVVKPISEKL